MQILVKAYIKHEKKCTQIYKKWSKKFDHTVTIKVYKNIVVIVEIP